MTQIALALRVAGQELDVFPHIFFIAKTGRPAAFESFAEKFFFAPMGLLVIGCSETSMVFSAAF